MEGHPPRIRSQVRCAVSWTRKFTILKAEFIFISCDRVNAGMCTYMGANHPSWKCSLHSSFISFFLIDIRRNSADIAGWTTFVCIISAKGCYRVNGFVITKQKKCPPESTRKSRKKKLTDQIPILGGEMDERENILCEKFFGEWKNEVA